MKWVSRPYTKKIFWRPNQRQPQEEYNNKNTDIKVDYDKDNHDEGDSFWSPFSS